MASSRASRSQTTVGNSLPSYHQSQLAAASLAQAQAQAQNVGNAPQVVGNVQQDSGGDSDYNDEEEFTGMADVEEDESCDRCRKRGIPCAIPKNAQGVRLACATCKKRKSRCEQGGRPIRMTDKFMRTRKGKKLQDENNRELREASGDSGSEEDFEELTREAYQRQTQQAEGVALNAERSALRVAEDLAEFRDEVREEIKGVWDGLGTAQMEIDGRLGSQKLHIEVLESQIAAMREEIRVLREELDKKRDKKKKE